MYHQYLLRKRLAVILAAICAGSGLIALLLDFLKLYPPYLTAWHGYVFIAIFAVFIPLLSISALKSRRATVIYIVLFNVIASFGFFFYIGIYTPFIAFWLLPFLLSYEYLGRKAAIASGVLFIGQTSVSAYVALTYYKSTLDYIILVSVLSLAAALAVIASGFVIYNSLNKARQRSKSLYDSQRAEQVQLNRLNTLLNSINDVVLTLNRYGRVTSQNAAALSFFDTNQSLIGKSIDNLFTPLDSSNKPVSVRKLAHELHSTIMRDDISVSASGDGTTRLSLQISPIRGTFDEDENGCVVIIRDITRQKTLEDEKDEFISVTSHELRTPVAIAEGSLGNLLFMFEKGVAPEKLAASATTAHDQVLYLARMINDLSTLSRAERGVGDVPEEIDVNVMLTDLYNRYQTEAAAKGLTLNLDASKLPLVTTSRLYLEEILQNFLTNAIKYTKEGTITLSGHNKDGKIECAVKDTGIGISKSDKEKVFDKFFRSEDYRTRETSGTGLGLYVVGKLAAKLNTKVDVESRLNHGSKFSFVLPLKSDKLGTGKRGSV